MIIKKRWLLLFTAYIFALGCLLTGMHGLVTELAYTDSIVSSKEEALADHTDSTADPSDNQKEIAKKVLRLHVIANSDSTKDQNIKLYVRDQILHSLQEDMKHVHSASEARKITKNHLTAIRTAAQKALASIKCDASVKVMVSKRYFPVKQYGDLTFPAGTYDALCVEIGEAKGHNWWCVLFPSLCFVNETTAVVPESSKESLKASLSDEAYNSLLSANGQALSDTTASPAASDSQPHVEVRFGIADWIRSKQH